MKSRNDDIFVDDSLKMYLKEINNYPLLKAEEEQILFNRLSNGDLNAKNQIIKSNLRLVVSIAKKYIGCGLPMIDLIQEGNIGLMRAIDMFDSSMNWKFSTYATYWIKQSISRALSNQGRIIRLPANIAEGLVSLKKAKRELMNKLGEIPTDEQLANYMGININTLLLYSEYQAEVSSLDAQVKDDDDTTVADLIEDKNFENPEKIYMKEAERELLDKVLDTLSLKEKEVIKYKFGLMDNCYHSLEDIGNIYGVTKERIRQIEVSAFKKLRQPLRAKKLMEIMN